MWEQQGSWWGWMLLLVMVGTTCRAAICGWMAGARMRIVMGCWGAEAGPASSHTANRWAQVDRQQQGGEGLWLGTPV